MLRTQLLELEKKKIQFMMEIVFIRDKEILESVRIGFDVDPKVSSVLCCSLRSNESTS